MALSKELIFDVPTSIQSSIPMLIIKMELVLLYVLRNFVERQTVEIQIADTKM
jgi:hypothetical protein